MQKCVFPNRFLKFENFVPGEWRQDKFLQGSVRDNMRLSFLKQASKDKPYVHAAGALNIYA